MKEEQFIREGLDVHFEVVDRAQDIVPAFLDRLATTTAAPDDSEITDLF